jgi:prepilin-type N-terminal cleavage/methylation domain-containing protein
MKLKKILKNNNGLTLLEVLVSLAILGILLIGAMKFFTQAYSFTSSNQNKTIAINVARNAIMYMERQSFIEIRKNFDDSPNEPLVLMICNDRYQLIWPTDTVEPDCSPITINNIKYDVNIQTNTDEAINSFFIPIKVKVDWEMNNKHETTSLEGVIKSEDIR